MDRGIAVPTLGGRGGLANGVLGSKSGEPLAGRLPGETASYRWRGIDVTYTEGGDPTAPDLVLYHGIHAAASSQEFIGVWDRLTDAYHVVAPDLPGFGRSDRPNVRYRPAFYEAFLAAFTDDVLTDPVCLATSLTGAYAAAIADGRFQRLVLVCPTATTTAYRPWLARLIRSPVVGEALFTALTIPRSLRWWMVREGVEDLAHLPADYLRYQHRTARRPGARYAPAAFIGGALTPDTRLVDTLDATSVPATLVWGRTATRPPLSVGRDLAEATDTDLLVVDDARLLPHTEHPTTVLDGLADLGVLDRFPEPDVLVR